MSELRHVPEPMTRTQFLEVLDDIRKRVEAGDSMEGSLEYTFPDVDSEEDLSVEFMVLAAYRVGNLQGQGSVRIVGTFVPKEPGEPDNEWTPKAPIHTPTVNLDDID